MKKLVLGFAITAVMGLSACGDNSSDSSEAPTKVNFSPSVGSIPLPNDLLFAGTANLTLNPPVEDESDYSDPLVAVSSLDGWSATAPFSFSFSNADGVDLNSATVIPGTSIRMFEVNVARPEAIPGSGIPVPTGPVTSVVRELVAGKEYVSAYAGELSAAVIPLLPLTPQATYMIVVTDLVADKNGNSVVADDEYLIAKSEQAIAEGDANYALEPVRQLVNAMESAAAEAGLSKEKIVMSFQFTIQSVGDLITTTKQVYIDAPFAMGAVTPSSFSSLMADTTPFTGLGAADLYKGQVDLTYYLTAPDSLGNPAHPGVANQFSVIQDFMRGAAAFPDGQGGSIPNPFAADVTTYANKLAAATGVETAPLLVSMPKSELGCAKPDAGYPVLIFQHGITGDRTNMLGIADAMAAPPTCTAVVAMDLPIHGISADNPVHQGLQAASGGMIGIFEGYTGGGVRERTFGVDYVNNETGAPGSDGVADSSGTHTINLSNLLMSRDNGRQAILDLLALEKAIPSMDIDGDDVADFDITNIKFMGHSLGGIVGAGFLGHSDLVESAVLANPGSGIALMLDASPTFGPSIRAGLAAQGVEAGSPDYSAFLFATQTAIDSMDPASTSAFAVANGVPTLMLQNVNDTVIPNLVDMPAAQSGTTPMAEFLNLTDLTAAEPGFVAGTRLFSRLNDGGHSSVVSPEEAPLVTVEMQKQIVSFLSSPQEAKGVLVTDETLLVQ